MTKKNLVPKSSSTESTKYIVLQWSTLVAPTRLWSVDRSKTYTNAILPFLISKCAKVRTWEHRHIARRPNYHIIFVLIIQHAAPCNILRTDRGRHQRLWTMCGGWYSGGKSSRIHLNQWNMKTNISNWRSWQIRKICFGGDYINWLNRALLPTLYSCIFNKINIVWTPLFSPELWNYTHFSLWAPHLLSIRAQIQLSLSPLLFMRDLSTQSTQSPCMGAVNIYRSRREPRHQNTRTNANPPGMPGFNRNTFETSPIEYILEMSKWLVN